MHYRSSIHSFFLTATLLTSGAAVAQQPSQVGPSPSTCLAPTGAEVAAQARWLSSGTMADCSATNTTIRSEYDPTNGLYRIPVVWHVIHASNNAGNIQDSFIHSQMRVLNETFNALPGTPAENGHAARIWFYLATEDPNGNPTDGIDRVQDDVWFNEVPSFSSPAFTFFPNLAWDTNRYLNIYTKKLPFGFFGGANNPHLPGVIGSPDDWVVLSYDAVGSAPINNSPPYDRGITGTHEVGHWLGLPHTFEGGCVSSTLDCYQTGDLVCDTPTTNLSSTKCTNKNTCGTPDPIENYMGYARDSCRDRFTPEQVNRMRCTLANWRPDVHQTFFVDRPPYDYVHLFGRAMPVQTLRGGQVLLLETGPDPRWRTRLLIGPETWTSRVLLLDPSRPGRTIHFAVRR